MNQFVQKLFPFSQWIGGGNVRQQAQESGLSFDIDITQDGYNTGQRDMSYESLLGGGSIAVGANSTSITLTPPTVPVYIRGIILPIDSLTLLSAATLQIDIVAQIRDGGTVDQNGNVSASAFSTFLGTFQKSFFISPSVLIPVDRNVLNPANNITLELSLNRNVAVGETVSFLAPIVSAVFVTPGLRIVSP